MKCPKCGHTMTHHANKLLRDGFEPGNTSDSQLIEAYSCPHCGTNASRVLTVE